MTEKRAVSVERVIAASPDAIFEVLADPTRHPEIDGSGSVKKVREGTPQRLALGADFGMDMKIGMPYRVQNEVVEFEEDRKIGVAPHESPRVALRARAGRRGHACVTETFDWAHSRAPWCSSSCGRHSATARRWSRHSCGSRRSFRADPGALDYLGCIRMAPSRRMVSPLR